MLDPVLLRTFVTIARGLSFTGAGEMLGLGQSTVSQHVRRLETQVGRRLFLRDTHSVRLTPDGEAMLGFARAILDAGERATRHFATSRFRGRLRFGTSEDFALTRLPDILAEWTRRHPFVELELTVGLSGLLYEQLDAGELDLIFVKRRRGDGRGSLIWRDQLVWVGRPGVVLDPAGPVPLVLFPPPSITRERALESLAHAGRTWRLTCTSGSLSALCAAALAGLGVAAHARRLVPPDLAELGGAGLPELGDIEFVMLGGPKRAQGAAADLAAVVAANGDRLGKGTSGKVADVRASRPVGSVAS